MTEEPQAPMAPAQGNGALFEMGDLLPLLARILAATEFRVAKLGQGETEITMREYGIADAQAYGNLWAKNLMQIAIEMKGDMDPDDVCAMLCFAAHSIGYQIAVERLTNNPED